MAFFLRLYIEAKPSSLNYSPRVRATEATVLTKYNQIPRPDQSLTVSPPQLPEISAPTIFNPPDPTTIRVSGIFCVTLIVTMISAKLRRFTTNISGLFCLSLKIYSLSSYLLKR